MPNSRPDFRRALVMASLRNGFTVESTAVRGMSPADIAADVSARLRAGDRLRIGRHAAAAMRVVLEEGKQSGEMRSAMVGSGFGHLPLADRAEQRAATVLWTEALLLADVPIYSGARLLIPGVDWKPSQRDFSQELGHVGLADKRKVFEPMLNASLDLRVLQVVAKLGAASVTLERRYGSNAAYESVDAGLLRAAGTFASMVLSHVEHGSVKDELCKEAIALVTDANVKQHRNVVLWGRIIRSSTEVVAGRDLVDAAGVVANMLAPAPDRVPTL
jgi:hypothetical protein